MNHASICGTKGFPGTHIGTDAPVSMLCNPAGGTERAECAKCTTSRDHRKIPHSSLTSTHHSVPIDYGCPCSCSLRFSRCSPLALPRGVVHRPTDPQLLVREAPVVVLEAVAPLAHEAPPGPALPALPRRPLLADAVRHEPGDFRVGALKRSPAAGAHPARPIASRLDQPAPRGRGGGRERRGVRGEQGGG